MEPLEKQFERNIKSYINLAMFFITLCNEEKEIKRMRKLTNFSCFQQHLGQSGPIESQLFVYKENQKWT